MKAVIVFFGILFVCMGCSPSGEDSGPRPQAAHTGPQLPADEALAKIYQRSCFSCHARGVNGAPRSGDLAAWAPRREQGLETLVQHTRQGYKAMPPRGLCFDCSDEDYAALIQFMAGMDQ